MHIRLYLVAALICLFSQAEGSAKLAGNANSAPISGETSVPYGWVDFCQRYRGECDGADLPSLSVTLTWQTMEEIRRINDGSNHKSFRPRTLSTGASSTNGTTPRTGKVIAKITR